MVEEEEPSERYLRATGRIDTSAHNKGRADWEKEKKNGRMVGHRGEKKQQTKHDIETLYPYICQAEFTLLQAIAEETTSSTENIEELRHEVMNNSLQCALILLSLMWSNGSSVQRDMDGDVFVFQINNRSYVALNPLKEEALHSFTICLRTFTDRPGGYGLFEFRSNAPYNSEITVWKSYYKVYILTVGGEAVDFATPDVINQWVHLCFSWGSANGTARAWLDLHPLPRKGLSKGYIIQGTPTIKLGMRRDNPSNDYQQHGRRCLCFPNE
ncbi:hypothetical protein NDU88_004999 [Pleurodeles waltl]|uniref:Pentraxin (PTX) domain-containing protein n=1 Tax=Pleurodeles waltl TaxID=8319 RepID=A0AAV7L883_PLEWA|nr:hypothetical protein NDU88_004999 [Pleurodeles waltl]